MPIQEVLSLLGLLLVNGQCIARGDVVVIDDNFGIRITEILQKPDINELTKF